MEELAVTSTEKPSRKVVLWEVYNGVVCYPMVMISSEEIIGEGEGLWVRLDHGSFSWAAPVREVSREYEPTPNYPHVGARMEIHKELAKQVKDGAVIGLLGGVALGSPSPGRPEAYYIDYVVIPGDVTKRLGFHFTDPGARRDLPRLV